MLEENDPHHKLTYFSTFTVQTYGAGMAFAPNTADDKILTGIHIYMGGVSETSCIETRLTFLKVGLQELFIILFLLMMYHFHLRLRAEAPIDRRVRAHALMQVVVASLALITVRIIFRLVEYASGLHSPVPNHEAS